MNHLLLFAVSAGFGSLAWVMLSVSDWLLGEKKDPQAARRLCERPAKRPGIDGRSVARNTSPRAIVPTARKAS
jgi:hypothetical protein